MPLLECVPNFSEGRDLQAVGKIVAEIDSVTGAYMLDCSSDEDHNRSVITFCGEPDTAAEAAFCAIKKASELIDMTKHRGGHPRMGATDVCPFVPLESGDMPTAVAAAEKLGKRVGEELGIPVFLYENAAKKPERRNLADVRRGQFEGLKEVIGKDPARMPDFGPDRIHPAAGATAIGARQFLIAYNVNLDTDDVELAKHIAKKIREKGGGLPGVKALGIDLGELGIVQVSMNLTDYTSTGMEKVYLEIQRMAGEHGCEVLESEVIGLMPGAAFEERYKDDLKMTNFTDDQIVEMRVKRVTNG
ncbi:MAG: glutamate formimidoyltransferase [Planctomycetota bacterium]|jgi:glutamate formiminotransferase